MNTRQSVIDQDQRVALMPSLLAIYNKQLKGILSGVLSAEMRSATQEMRQFPVCRLLDKHASRQGSSLYRLFLLIVLTHLCYTLK